MNTGITPDSDIIRGIVGVLKETTGVDIAQFRPVISRQANIEPVVERINPPHLIHPPVVEDVDSDEEDDDDDGDYVDPNAARQSNVVGTNVDDE